MTCSSLISACAQRLMWHKALELLTQVAWEPLACGAALRACLRQWRRGLRLYHDMSRAAVRKDAEVHAALIAATGLAGRVSLVREALRDLQEVAMSGLRGSFRHDSTLSPSRQPKLRKAPLFERPGGFRASKT